MDGDRIMNAATDAALLEIVEHAVAVGHAQGIHMIDMLAAGSLEGCAELRNVGEEIRVSGGMGSAPGVVRVQVRQFHAEHSRLDAVHPGVPSNDIMMVFPGLAMVAEHAHAIGERGIVGGDGAGFAEGTEVFAGIKAETTGDTEAAGAAALVSGAVGLAGVLDHGDAVPVRDLEDGRPCRRIDRANGLE